LHGDTIRIVGVLSGIPRVKRQCWVRNCRPGSIFGLTDTETYRQTVYRVRDDDAYTLLDLLLFLLSSFEGEKDDVVLDMDDLDLVCL
jgi:hypothetical protein